MGIVYNISAEPMKFRRYSLDQGLSQGTIRTIAQDTQGFLWFGSQDGLNRFDGYQFDIFIHDNNNPNSLSSDYIRDVYQSPQGNFYVATRFGLTLFNRHNETFTPIKLYDNPERQIEVNAILADSNNTLWIATHDGLFAVNVFDNQVTHFKHQSNNPNSLLSNAVYSLFIDKHQTLWVGTEKGLSSYIASKQSFMHWLDESLPTENKTTYNISTIVEDHHDNLWVGTYNSGLIKLNPAQNSIKHFTHAKNGNQTIAHDRVRALLVDKQQQLWIGTRGGLSIMQLSNEHISNHYHHTSVSTSLSDSHIWSLFADDNDSIWLGTSGGISQYVQSSKLFGHNTTSDIKGQGINYKKVRSIYKTVEEHLWIGTDKGLNHYNPTTKSYQYYAHDSQNPTSISKGMITAVFVDRQQRVWAGSYDGGLNRLIPSKKQPDGQFKRYIHQKDNANSISHNRVYSIMQDNNDTLWIGTLHGLNRFDPTTEKFERFYHQADNPNSLGFDGIYATLQTSDGDIWIATRGGGLSRYNHATKQFSNYKHDAKSSTSLSHDRVFAIHQNTTDILWVATSDGLNKLHIPSGQFSRYGKQHGLSNETVYAVTSDQSGFIWISTNRGLARFDPISERFKTYEKKRGLQSNEYNNGAYFKAPDGELLFGGVNGFNRFYPENIKDNQKPPKLVISQFYLANQYPQLRAQNPLSPLIKVANQTQAIELNHQQPVFSFQFAALHYIDSAKNRYAYRLEGFDNDWTYTNAANRRATYTNLPAGDYVFKLKAANSDSLWTKQAKTIRLTIHPAPWLTWWAYLTYVLVSGSIIAAFIWQHWHKQESIKQSEHRLQLALWSSGNQFWDWDFVKKQLMRSTADSYTLPIGSMENIKRLQPVIHPDDFQTLVNTFNRHLRGYSDYFECAYRIKDHNNQWLWLLDRGKVVNRNNNGKALRAIGTVQDITPFKAVESQLRELNEQLELRVKKRTEELAATVDSLAATVKELTQTQEQLLEAEKAAALGNLVAGVAHELNTPIGICITSISTLSSASDKLFAQQTNNQLTRQDFNRYKQTSQQSLQLVTDNLMRSASLVQTFKMIAVQQHNEERALCQLNNLLQSIISTFTTQLTNKQIAIEITGEPDITIKSFGNSLDVMFSQLINNSLQHGFEAATKGNITISIEPEKEHLNVKYHDNGCGLESKSKDQLFEPFFTTNRARGHTGLGMHIVFNHITQKLGGTIKIDEYITNGLGYVIELPMTVR